MKKLEVSVLIPTLGRDTLYALVNSLLKQKTSFDYEIVLLPQRPLFEDRIRNKKIRFKYEKEGKGFAYYRNALVKLAKGNILVWIDDDELPMNANWLEKIAKPILQGGERVTTAGVKIELGEGYTTDSISLLGFPGGGAVGFEVMWFVDDKGYTRHLCSGNFAIDRKILTRLGNFTLRLKSGSEDVDLAEKIAKQNIKIKYEKEATVYHVSRKGYFNFVKWNFLRGKSAAQYLRQKKSDSKKVGGRLSSSIRILARVLKTEYFFGVLFMMVTQYFWQTMGYLVGRLEG